ncbi:hypothetical protein [Pedobacter nototheniae]|uniref:hypothetical protein n=1 Tax=Pedobacter nototheniae TaxID=2488994 RepID=UPI00103D8BC2|nr:hypothetical protein [Pedobacter nototheniae]
MESKLSTTHLQELLIKKYFYVGWTTEYLTKTVPDATALLINSIQNISLEILNFYNLFILNGDYCLESYVKFDEESEKLKVFIQARIIELNDLLTLDVTLVRRGQVGFLENVIRPLDNIIVPGITYLLKDIERQFSLTKDTTTFRVEKQNKDVYNYIVVGNTVEIFKSNLAIANFEHFNYSYTENNLISLIVIQKRLLDSGIKETENPLLAPLHEKVNFLIKKMVYRLKCDKKDESLGFSVDHYSVIPINTDSFPVSPQLQDWIEIIDIHYDLAPGFLHLQRKRVESFDDSNNEGDYIYYHALAKTYKDDSASVEQLKNLRTEFSKAKLDVPKIFNKFALQITSNYLYNNQISLATEQAKIEKATFRDEISDDVRELQNFQNKTFVHNFFPWEKICLILANKIEKLSDDLLNNTNFELFKILLEQYSSVLGKFEYCFKWSKGKNFVHFQLPFEQCKSEVKINVPGYGEHRLFFFTSFVIPLDYVSEEQKLNTMKLNKIKFDTLLNSYGKLAVVVDNINKTADKVRNTERRSIEILAIFSAISLFSVGTIQLLTNVVIGTDPMLFYRMIISYGYCLILFAIVIWVMTRENVGKVGAYHFVLLGIIAITAILVIFAFYNYDLVAVVMEKAKIEK